MGCGLKLILIIIIIYRDVSIAAIASSRTSRATQTAAICVRFQRRCVRHVYITMQVTFLTRKSALIYRPGLRQRVASLIIDCNGVFAIKAYCHATARWFPSGWVGSLGFAEYSYRIDG